MRDIPTVLVLDTHALRHQFCLLDVNWSNESIDISKYDPQLTISIQVCQGNDTFTVLFPLKVYQIFLRRI